ncbi:hypothetical protein LUCX_71 [Xanthomonas phage vB_XciM_LucasX]|nr:hypothetical protein LUCX_71 [Xanthomonas phage vB_XciM_LucasX]
MNTVQIAVENRDVGQVPVSIGTSLALEGAFGIYPDRPEMPPPLQRVRQVWVNLRTIVRNLYACLPTEVRDMVLPDDLWQAALGELTIIRNAVTQTSRGQVQVVYYVSDYARMHQRFPGAILREPKTPKQIFQHKIEDTTLRMMLERNHDQHVELYDFDITGQHQASFIITHLPVDLLARYRFERLELLESHTGIVKGPAAWNTKLTNGRELSNIPFNKFTLQLFGDNGNMFAPQAPTLRKTVLALAHRWSWTNVSSLDLVRSTIQKVEIDEHRKALLSLL